jgi:hypothetical protein
VSLAETKLAAAEAEAHARSVAAEIVRRGSAQGATDTAAVHAETAEIILILAERRAELVRADDLARFRANVPKDSGDASDLADRFIAEHRLAAWVECLVDLGTIGGRSP